MCNTLQNEEIDWLFSLSFCFISNHQGDNGILESRYVTLPCKSEKSEFPQSGNFSFHRVYLPIGTDSMEPGVVRWVEQVCHLGGGFVLFIDHVIQPTCIAVLKNLPFAIYCINFFISLRMFLFYWIIIIIVNLNK